MSSFRTRALHRNGDNRSWLQIHKLKRGSAFLVKFKTQDREPDSNISAKKTPLGRRQWIDTTGKKQSPPGICSGPENASRIKMGVVHVVNLCLCLNFCTTVSAFQHRSCVDKTQGIPRQTSSFRIPSPVVPLVVVASLLLRLHEDQPRCEHSRAHTQPSQHLILDYCPNSS